MQQGFLHHEELAFGRGLHLSRTLLRSKDRGLNLLRSIDEARKVNLEDDPVSDNLTEQEQIELLKEWIKQYSLVILAGVIIAIVSITGWRYWQQRQTNILEHASRVYEEMLMMRAQNVPASTLIQAKKLLKHYSHTPYAQMAALMLARDAVTKNDNAEATKQLEWVLDHSKVKAISQIARIRLARVLISSNDPKAALKLLDKTDDETFKGLIQEVKGDAYVAMKDLAMARTAYQQALHELPNAEIVRPLLQMKYDNLAV